MSRTPYLDLNIPDKSSKGFVVTDVFEPNFTKLDQEAERVNLRKMSAEHNIEELKKADRYKLGDVVEVLGFYTKGDGAHHKRIAKAEDDGSGEQGQNGIWWCIVHNGEVNVSWFGAKGDGVTDDTTYFEKALKVSNIITSNKFNYVGILKLNEGKTIKNMNIKLDSIIMSRYANIENMVISPVDSNEPLFKVIDSNTGAKREIVVRNIQIKTDIHLNSSKKDCIRIEMKDGNGAWGLEFDTFYNDGSFIFNRVIAITSNINLSSNKRCWLTVTEFKNFKFYKFNKVLESYSYVEGRDPYNPTEYLDATSANVGTHGFSIHNCHFECESSSVLGAYIGIGTNANLEGLFLGDKHFASSNLVYYRIEDRHSVLPKLNKFSFYGATTADFYKYIKFTSGEIHTIDTMISKFSSGLNSALVDTRGPIVQTSKKSITFNGGTALNNKYVLLGVAKKWVMSELNQASIQMPVGRTAIQHSFPKTCYIDLTFDSNNYSCMSTADFGNNKLLISENNEFVFIWLVLSKGMSWIRPTFYIDYNITNFSTSTFMHTIEESEYNSLSLTKIFDIGITQVTTLGVLDTPYYTLKMQQEGIYEDYIAYRDELHEYENSQTSDETMLLPVLQEPVIPESVELFAKKYNLI